MKRWKFSYSLKQSMAVMLVIVLSVLPMSGCKSDKVNVNIKDGDLDISQSYFNKHYVAKGESGYYFINAIEKKIYYFDASARQTIPLCSKAECKHDNSQCMAHIEGALNDLLIFYCGGKLYWLVNEGGKCMLMQCEQDGSNHTEVAPICTYDDNSVFECIFVNGYIYFTENGGNEITDEDKNVKLKRMSLSDKKIENVYDYTGKGAVIQGLKGYSDDVYSYVTVVEETGDKMFKRSGKGLYVSSAKDNKTEKVVDDSVADFCLDTKNKCLYYYVYSDGLYKVKDNNKEMVIKATEQTGFCNLNFDGNYVYMDNSYWAFYSSRFMAQDYDIKKTIWIYDNGELKTSIDMAEKGLFNGGINGDTEYYFDSEDRCFSKKELFETGKINWIELK